MGCFVKSQESGQRRSRRRKEGVGSSEQLWRVPGVEALSRPALKESLFPGLGS